ncbi:hypothetical protein METBISCDRAFT_23107 [Metschnikowia bicuspidata]|uniref:Uncharacterized protein n=1 Tax=Metschnikowia bicuspidata TaxID=27322 RepID=A0A4P9ZD60_9ASCO|nr:hypothetical protein METBISCDRAFT_23107 [Metschnikowia bicuspidata]
MDLSTLSSDLPATSNIEHITVSGLNANLAGQFKSAAKSVTSLYNTSKEASASKAAFSEAARAVASLYRAGTECNLLLMHKGYLGCLDDLLHSIANGDDVENWVLSKRAELVNYYNQKENRDATLGDSPTKPQTVIPHLSSVTATNNASAPIGGTEIGPTVGCPPISITDSANFDPERIMSMEGGFEMTLDLATELRFRPSFPPLSMTYKSRKGRKETRRKPVSLIPESVASSEESDGDHLDPVEQKRRSRAANMEPKRRKRD